jgi:hypothetical protein
VFVLVNLPNGDLLNCVFEQVGVTCASCLEPGTEAFAVATRKRKADASKKVAVKKCVW